MAEVKLPTKEDIAKLPRWARVAFAARCARRALPLFVKHWPDAPKKHVNAVTRAVEVAEQSAASDAPPDADTAPDAALDAANDAVNDNDDDGALAARDAAAAAADAAYGECAAAGAAYDADTAPAHDADAIRAARDAARNAAHAGVAVPSIVRDFQLVLEQATQERWTDDTPVPPSVFGPLDESEPKPAVVPAASQPPKSFELAIEVFARKTADPEQAADRLVGLYEKLNEFSLLKYGRGLTVEEFEQFIRVGAHVPVGG